MKAVVSYDGTAYQGWQRQTNGLGIQQVIEEALESILHKPVRITASGRTDAGVHACGQVFHFDGRPDVRYVPALNALLPADIRILDVQTADEAFHARFCAKRKRYDYYVDTDWPGPFTYKYRWHVRGTLDTERMRQAAAGFLGTHDFTSFCNAKVEQEKDKVKTVTRLDIEEEGSVLHFIFEGGGFLRYQVRMMTGLLVAVGQGREEPDAVTKMLMLRNKHANRYCAPGSGLFLMEVDYG